MSFDPNEKRDDHGRWTAEGLRAEAARHGNNAVGNELRRQASEIEDLVNSRAKQRPVKLKGMKVASSIRAARWLSPDGRLLTGSNDYYLEHVAAAEATATANGWYDRGEMPIKTLLDRGFVRLRGPEDRETDKSNNMFNAEITRGSAETLKRFIRAHGYPEDSRLVVSWQASKDTSIGWADGTPREVLRRMNEQGM